MPRGTLSPHPARSRSAPRVALALAAVAVTLAVAILPSVAGLSASSPETGIHRGLPGVASPVGPGEPIASGLPNPVSLGISSAPGAICAIGGNTCPAGTGIARVTLQAAVAGATTYWPSVQILFVVDSTFYNGDYRATDDFGYDLCDRTGYQVPCEESNGIPFFVAHASAIVGAMQAANPRTQLSFALIDDYSTYCDYGDCDGPLYHVDFGQFVPATEFPSMVGSTYRANVLDGGYTCADCDYWDNFLHSPSISAFYVGMMDPQVQWSPKAHHVLVWMGDSAPRDPAYVQNYCVSGWDGGLVGGSCYGQGCEPTFVGLSPPMPQCEGWIRASDGNATHSIAALTRYAPSCVHSLGGRCTIDTIDLYSTNTDPYSIGWPTDAVTGYAGGGPGGSLVLQNVNRILLAGCDLAAATGGTWDGPYWASCPDGDQGTLQYVPHGSADKPNLDNPSLLAAFRSTGYGAQTDVVGLAGTPRPMFVYVPIGSITPAPDLQASATCLRNGTPMATCQRQPTVSSAAGLTVLSWNWSTVPTTNQMFAGDLWTAQFDVQATGPPYASVPVDACVTANCRSHGSGQPAGLYTWAQYVPSTNTTLTTASFDLAQVNVEAPVAPTSGPPPAPPPPAVFFPPGIGVASPVGQPVLVPVVLQTGLGAVSLNAIAAGILAAGLTRISIRNRQVAMAIAVSVGSGRPPRTR